MKPRSFSLLLSCGFLLASPVALAADQKEVTISQPIEREVFDFADYTGRADATQTVELRARVTGYLQRALFRDGAEVKKGDLLFEIDPRPYQAAFDRARAKLVSAEATVKLAQAERDNAQKLAAANPKAISQDQLRQLESRQVQAEAEVRVAQANLEGEKLNLDFTRVQAPIDGRISRRLLDPGNLVKADDTLLATIVNVDPVYIYFDMDERGFLRFSQAWAGVQNDAAKMPVGLALMGEEGFPHKGQLDYQDPRVDPNSGTVRLRAVTPNPKKKILPGMFVRCRLPLSKPYQGLLVNPRSIYTDAGKMQEVLVINEKSTVEVRAVKFGQMMDGLRVIREGLKAGEWVIVGDLSKIRPGDVVKTRRVAMPKP
jgi:RND family efflux transporter MFP subunit